MKQIGRYEIEQELGRGAMGAVYKARDPQIGRTVAIKVILTANLSKEDLEHYKQRFYREAQTAGQLTHPGIVTIHDIAEDEQGQPYLVMEYVDGTTLETLLMPSGKPDNFSLKVGTEKFPVSQAVDIGVQLAEALDYAHRCGVIHRDIKPSNILVSQEGGGSERRLRAKIVDFGIAKVAGTGLTQTGMVMGTPAFMSPEQVSMTGVDARSDLFSLGAVLYWMFTGEKPFPGESLTQITFKVVFGAPLPAAYVNPKLPPELDVVLSRCLAKNPDDRYPSAQELAADLELIKAGQPLKTTAAPLADMTVLQSNPLPVVAAGLPPEKRAPHASAPDAIDTTVHVGSRSRDAAAQAAAPSAAPIKPRGSKLLLGAGAAALVLLATGYFFWPKKHVEPPVPPQTQVVQQTEPTPSPAPTETLAPAPPPLAETEKPEETTIPAARTTKSAPPTPETPKPPETTIPATAAPAKKPEAPAVTEEKKTAPAAVEKTSAPAPAPSPTPAAMKANLQIECRNNFDEATLAIAVDGKTLLKEPLVNKKPLNVLRPVAAGQHAFVVRVIAKKDKFDQRQEIGAKFEAGETKLLVIEFGKFSGLGFRGRKLSLKWGK